ncbi:hypothetical protein ES708_11325 [subsurface metagenome]
MRFAWDILVTPEDKETNKKVVTLPLAHGIITLVSILFPPGCHKMVHCVIRHYEHAIFPSVEDMSISGDTTPVEWNEYYEMYREPYELKAELWGVNCRYDHTVGISIVVLPRKAVISLAIVDAIKSVFGLLSPKRIFTRTQGEK